MALLLMILLVYIIRPGDWIPGLDLRWNLILNILGSIALAALIISGKARNASDKTWIYLGGFFALMLLSSTIMGQLPTIPLYAPQMLTNILVYILVCSVVQKARQIYTITWGFVILALIVAYQCHLQITTGENIAGIAPLVRGSIASNLEDVSYLGTTLQSTWVGIFEDPNDVGLLFVALLPLIMAHAIFARSQIYSRLSAGIAGLGLTYGVFLTDSRGTFVALLGGIGYFFILKYRSMKGLILALAGGFLLISVGPSRMGSITAADDSAMERVYAWIEALYAFSMYPYFGLGPKHWSDWHYKTTHNSFVLAFVENGFLAYVCWLSVILIPLYVVSKAAFAVEENDSRVTYCGLGASIAAVMLSIFFISRTYVLIPYFVAAIAITYARVDNKSQYVSSLNDLTFFKLGAAAAASITAIWVANILATRLML